MLTRIVLIAAAWAFAPAVQAQSMNVPQIVSDVMGEICVPYAESGDLLQAITAARSLGYAPVGHWADRPIDGRSRPNPISLTRRHHGTVTLAMDYGRGLCSVGVAEGGPSSMGPAAEPFLREMGMEPLVDVREARRLDVVVWSGPGRLLVIATSPHYTPGSELVLTFMRSRTAAAD